MKQLVDDEIEKDLNNMPMFIIRTQKQKLYNQKRNGFLIQI